MWRLVILLTLYTNITAEYGKEQVLSTSLNESEVVLPKFEGLRHDESLYNDYDVQIGDTHTVPDSTPYDDVLIEKHNAGIPLHSTNNQRAEVEGRYGDDSSSAAHRPSFGDLHVNSDEFVKEAQHSGTRPDEELTNTGEARSQTWQGIHDNLQKVASNINVRGGTDVVSGTLSSINTADVHIPDEISLEKNSVSEDLTSSTGTPGPDNESDQDDLVHEETIEQIEQTYSLENIGNSILDLQALGEAEQAPEVVEQHQQVAEQAPEVVEQHQQRAENSLSIHSSVEHESDSKISQVSVDADIGDDKEEDAEQEAIREIVQLQKEETLAAEQEERDKIDDERTLRTLDEAAEQRTKHDLERDQSYFSRRNEDTAPRQALGLDHTGKASTYTQEGIHEDSAQEASIKAQASNVLGKKRLGGAIRGNPQASSIFTKESELSQFKAESSKLNNLKKTPELRHLLGDQFHMGRTVMEKEKARGAFGESKPNSDNYHKDRLQAYTLPRKVARPVERILAIYENDKTSLYDVLGLPKDCDDFDIKQAYRSIALEIHPDKNSHPRAKEAFDAVQDAFKTLSTPLARNGYDKDFSRRNRLTYKRLRKRTLAFFHNQFSIMQLLSYRVLKGESQGIVEEWKEMLRQRVSEAKELRLHFKLLPSLSDRFMLLHEIVYDNIFTIGQIIAFISLM